MLTYQYNYYKNFMFKPLTVGINQYNLISSTLLIPTFIIHWFLQWRLRERAIEIKQHNTSRTSQKSSSLSMAATTQFGVRLVGTQRFVLC